MRFISVFLMALAFVVILEILIRIWGFEQTIVVFLSVSLAMSGLFGLFGKEK